MGKRTQSLIGTPNGIYVTRVFSANPKTADGNNTFIFRRAVERTLQKVHWSPVIDGRNAPLPKGVDLGDRNVRYTPEQRRQVRKFVAAVANDQKGPVVNADFGRISLARDFVKEVQMHAISSRREVQALSKARDIAHVLVHGAASPNEEISRRNGILYFEYGFAKLQLDDGLYLVMGEVGVRINSRPYYDQRVVAKIKADSEAPPLHGHLRIGESAFDMIYDNKFRLLLQGVDRYFSKTPETGRIQQRMKTAVIIGAGPAGLTAAYELLEKGGSEWKVTVVEATDAIGGISRTLEHNGNRFDIGPHRFFSKSDEVNALWDKLMPLQGAPARDDIELGRKCTLKADGPDPEKTDRVMLRRHRLTRIYYLRHFFDYPISIKPATFLAMGLGRTWKAGWSYLYSAFFKRPEKSLEDFYINRFGKVLYSMFFEDYTEKLWGIHPSKISPEWGAQRVKGLSLWKALLNVFIPKGGKKETSLIEEFSYPKFGAGQFYETLADEIRKCGGEIRHGFKVSGFKTEGGKVTAVVSAAGEVIACDAVFSSMPIKDLVAAFGHAPADVARIAVHLPYRDLITVNLLVDRLALKNDTKFPTLGAYIPDVWIYVQERCVRMGRLEIYNNFSPYLVQDPKNRVWIAVEYFCSEGDAFWSMSDDAFVEKCVGELKTAGIFDEKTVVYDRVHTRTLKAYPAYFGTYAEFGKVRAWLDGFANLYCIGRNGQHRYNNMDHSMLCGMEAARALLGQSDKAALWDVNTEKEYHETK